MTDTKFISFYSYKGGSGRSTTCINTILHMISEYKASPERPLLLVDADIESAGLTHYFHLQNKFTGCFEKTLHTTRLFTNISVYLDSVNADYVFNKNVRYSPVPREILNAFKSYLALATISGDVDTIFKDIQLNTVEIGILKAILNSSANVLTSDNPSANDIMVASAYTPGTLIEKLSEAIKSITDPDRLIAEKRRIIVDFLPAYSFCDISSYFGAAPGTVRFLGVDVNFAGVLSIPGNVTEALQPLREVCKFNDVCAVVFDCSAGTQCTAHMMHSMSDVLVYCLRPSLQFIVGTLIQLKKYSPVLTESATVMNKLDEHRKMVILLPTAVPIESKYDLLGAKNFLNINIIADTYSSLVDNTFCSREEALNEVSIFKWCELILGTENCIDGDNSVKEITQYFVSPDTMPEDARRAYHVYKKLAARILANSGDNCNDCT